MKFIQPIVEVWKQEIPPMILSTDAKAREAYVNLYLKGMYKHIERCGRVCYKSEDKLGEKDPKIFVDRMIKSEHLSVLEHGTVYLYYKWNPYSHEDDIFISKYKENPYSKCLLVRADDDVWEDGSIHDIMNGVAHGEGEYVITTNYRVIIENGWEDDLKYLCCPTKYHALRSTLCFTTDIGVSREMNRHRTHSVSEESTRYCNYSKEKFGGNITFTIPNELSNTDLSKKVEEMMSRSIVIDHNGEPLSFMPETVVEHWTAVDWYIWSLVSAELAYMKLIEKGWTAQQARRVLPLNTKTTLIHTAFDSDWQHFWDLRVKGTTGMPHPDMALVARKAYEKMKK